MHPRFCLLHLRSAAFALYPPVLLRCGLLRAVTAGLSGSFAIVLKAMASFDFSAEIKELRTIFTSIAAVSDIEGIERAIEDLSAQAAAPDLWDDVENAQKVTSHCRISSRN